MSGGRRTSRRGQALLEFSIAAPLFLFVLLATVDLGRLMAMWTGLANGAREAARVASLPAASGSGTRGEAEVLQAVRNLVPPLSAPAFDPSRHVRLVCRDPSDAVASCAGRTSGWSVEVVVAYPFSPLPPFSAPLGAFSSFGASPFSAAECSASFTYAGQTFSLGGEAGCIVLTAAARGRVE